jgi:hypothetical protein
VAPKPQPLPAVKQSGWIRQPLDRFIRRANKVRAKPREESRVATIGSGQDLETKIFSASGRGRIFPLTSIFIEIHTCHRQATHRGSCERPVHWICEDNRECHRAIGNATITGLSRCPKRRSLGEDVEFARHFVPLSRSQPLSRSVCQPGGNFRDKSHSFPHRA